MYQNQRSYLAEKEGFEPSRQLPQPTPLAGEPLTANLGTSPYFIRCWRRERDLNPRCLSASPVFKTGSINHSDISPRLHLMKYSKFMDGLSTFESALL